MAHADDQPSVSHRQLVNVLAALHRAVCLHQWHGLHVRVHTSLLRSRVGHVARRDRDDGLPHPAESRDALVDTVPPLCALSAHACMDYKGASRLLFVL